MNVDKITVFMLLFDLRDYVHVRGNMKRDATGMVVSKPRLPMFVRNNIDDMHVGGDPIDQQEHDAAVQRMIANGQLLRSVEFDFPAGVTCRTTPFSAHPTQICKEFVESDMDFGEVDANDLPILHDKQWAKFTFAVNGNDQDNVIADNVDALTARFGNIGM